MDNEDQYPHLRRENWAPDLTRRSWMQRAAWISAGMALPRIAWAAAQDASPAISPVMEKLSAYMAEARNRALPDNVVQETEHHILDTIAAMVSGSELPPGRMAIQFAQDLWRREDCHRSRLADRLRTDRGGIRQRNAGSFR